jgi:RimJ/RimL family protein N-acetyltransferase
MLLKTKRLLLKEIVLHDLEDIHALHSLPETDEFNTLGIPDSVEVTQQIMSEWILLAGQTPREKYVFRIEKEDDHAFVGLFGLNIGKEKFKNAEIWYKLHPKHWQQGYATEVVLRILDLCFNDLKLHRIEAGCATQNIGSIKVLEKSGFRREGQKRKILPIRGQWVDNYFYAILEEDFLEK